MTAWNGYAHKLTSRPSRARGLKLRLHLGCAVDSSVAPFTGAWIETRAAASASSLVTVAPFTGAWIETRGRVTRSPPACVAPFTGAWIETGRSGARNAGRSVAPFTGAWIETAVVLLHAHDGLSRPSRARGLKHPQPPRQLQPPDVAPFTGAWIETACRGRLRRWRRVAPFTGAWIETYYVIRLL